MRAEVRARHIPECGQYEPAGKNTKFNNTGENLVTGSAKKYNTMIFWLMANQGIDKRKLLIGEGNKEEIPFRKGVDRLSDIR